MFAFLGWLVVGMIAGSLARGLVPGRQPMGLLMTMSLGLVGSVIGGLISLAIWGSEVSRPGFHPGGLFLSTMGAVIALALYVRSFNRHHLGR